MLGLDSFQLIFKKTNIFLLVILLSLSACNKDVTILQDLDQDTANDIILLLRENSIEAKKIEKNKLQSVNVSSTDETRALALINAYGKPDKKFKSLGEIFKKDGFISSPTEEQARLVYGLEQEISGMIAQIEGVINVNVQVALPTFKDDLWDTDNSKPSAAILVIYLKKYRIDRHKERIKKLVSKAIPNLNINDVEIAFIPKNEYDIKIPTTKT
jgi:type III secretion protein J